MNLRTISLLALLTAGVVALALVATLARRSGAPAAATALLPGFQAQVNDAALVTVRQGDRTATLRLDGDRWRVTEKGGYPAKFEDIKSLIVSLADLKSAEPKTANPDLYAKIGVEDPALANDATLVTVADGTGAPIASLIVGDAASTGGRFVRVAGQPQSWLVSASINAPADPLAWVDREIIRLDSSQIALVRTEQDGDTLAISRAGDGAFIVDGLPEDRAPKPDADLRRFAGAMAFLSLTDVAPLDGSAVPADARTTTFTRTDGVSLAVRSWRADEKFWLTIGVSRPTGDDLSDDARLQADDYTARFSGWRFAVDEFRFNTMRPSLDDLSTARAKEGPAAPIAPSGE